MTELKKKKLLEQQDVHRTGAPAPMPAPATMQDVHRTGAPAPMPAPATMQDVHRTGAPAPMPAAARTGAPAPMPAAPAPMPAAPAPARAGDYNPGQNVQDAYQQYLAQMQAQPGAFSSQWQGQMDDLYGQISNRPEFKYDMNADLLYQQMKDQYARSGQLGMMNSMGQASALTGGYANSWAQTAGQQTYDSYMQELNNNLPALEDRAYGRYQDEGNQLAQRFGMAGQLYGRDYGQYRDQVGDWQYSTGMAMDQYNNERVFDYGAYVDQTNWTREDKQRAEQWAREDAIRAQEQAAAQAAAAAAVQAAAAASSRRRSGGSGLSEKEKLFMEWYEEEKKKKTLPPTPYMKTPGSMNG